MTKKIDKEYPSNSIFETKEEVVEKTDERKIEVIAKGELIEKPVGTKKLFGNIFSGENISAVASYIMESVILPGIKNIVFDAGTKGLERAMWGDDLDRRTFNHGGIVNYSAISTGRSQPRISYGTIGGSRHKQDTNTYLLSTRVEAEEVLYNLRSLIDQYGHASVADYYEMVGKTGSYTDNKWGWTDIRRARVVRSSGGGYVIDLPKAIAID